MVDRPEDVRLRRQSTPVRAGSDGVDDDVPSIYNGVSRSGALHPLRRVRRPGWSPSTEDWPGNVRELRNVVERAIALSPGTTVGVEDLPPPLCGLALPTPGRAVSAEPAAAIKGRGQVL